MAVNVFEKTTTFIGEVRTEMSKVTWPTWENLKSYTAVVMVSTLVVASAIGILDKFLNEGLNFIVKFF